MSKTSLAAAALILMAASRAVQAEGTAPVVLELYTSQGCSSCPAADALLEELADQPGLLPLALHVDYWDYIGWADTFAHPGFTERQKAYARAAGERMIYTPQMIVGGVARVEGNDPAAVAEAIRAAQPDRLGPDLAISREGEGLRIRVAEWPEAATAPLKLQLVRFQPQAVVEIAHGENAGKTVTYSNIVTDWQALSDWPGTPPLDLLVPAPGADSLAVLLQSPSPTGGPGAILAAARLN